MSNSLRDQLLGLGFAPPPKPDPATARKPDARKPDAKSQAQSRPGQAPARAHERPSDRRPPRRNDGAPQRAPGGRGPGDNARPGANPRTSASVRDADKQAGRPREARTGRTREEIDLAKAYAIRAQREKDERIEAERVRQDEARVRREAKAKLAEFLQGKALNDPAAEIARHFPYGGKIKRVHVTEAQLKQLNAGELGVVQDNGRYLLVDAATLAQVEEIFAAAVALKVDPDAPAGDDPYADPRFQVPDDLVW